MVIQLKIEYVNIIYSHFDGLVPVDDVSGEREGLDVDDVHVPALRAHVDPLGGERQVQARDPTTRHTRDMLLQAHTRQGSSRRGQGDNNEVRI